MYYLVIGWRPPPSLGFFSEPTTNLAYNIIQSRTKENVFCKGILMFSAIFGQFLAVSW